uniref:Regulatory protein zeste n=1 Tax=Glossina brevipalpis TaxID=37001 RepID=A0A1A9WM10_9MUSC
MGMVKRTVKEWRRVWTTHKYKEKKKLSDNRLSLKKTETGPKFNEERIIETANSWPTIASVASFGAPDKSFDDDALPSISKTVRSPSMIDFTDIDVIPTTASEKRKYSFQNAVKRRKVSSSIGDLHQEELENEREYRTQKLQFQEQALQFQQQALQFQQQMLQIQQQTLQFQQQGLQCQQQALQIIREIKDDTKSFQINMLQLVEEKNNFLLQQIPREYSDISDEA